MNLRTLTLSAALVFGALLLLTACTRPRKDYEPTQPIAFSHYLHAGQNEIPCQYCHTAPAMGRHSSIPSTNICMNCHSVVATDRPEIQKLVKSYESGERIEWVKVHDLPDFAYFNHQPHVNYFLKNQEGNDKPGRIEGVCANCHGQVNEMEKVATVNEFNMGWCVNCHRQYEAPLNCTTCHR
jgi:hypothetical protein